MTDTELLEYVISIYRKKYSPHKNREDLLGDAWIAVDKSIKSYDESRGHDREKFIVTQSIFHMLKDYRKEFGTKVSRKTAFYTTKSIHSPLTSSEEIAIVDTLRSRQTLSPVEIAEASEYSDLLKEYFYRVGGIYDDLYLPIWIDKTLNSLTFPELSKKYGLKEVTIKNIVYTKLNPIFTIFKKDMLERQNKNA